MSGDIRIDLDFLNHRKRKKLQFKLGAEGVLALIDLWMSIAEHRSSGVLNGYDEMDIEIDANWRGEPGLFVSTLLDLGFLEKKDEAFAVHNWKERQPWVSAADDRSAKARLSILAKNHPELVKQLKNKGVNQLSKVEYAELKDHGTYQGRNISEIERGVNGSNEKGNDSKGKTHESLTTTKGTPNDSQTTPQEPVNESLTKRKAVVNDSKKKNNASLTTAKGNANDSLTSCEPELNDSFTPFPSPSPSPYVKENPGNSPGTFLKSDRKVKPKAGGKDTAEYFKAINLACEEILDLPAKKKAFNPYQWAQVQIKNHAHPGAVAGSLRGLIMFWRTADSPWSYGDTILKTKNGNFNEAEAIKIHEEMKSLKPKELEVLTHGLFKNVKI
jgi:hypothetical protein